MHSHHEYEKVLRPVREIVRDVIAPAAGKVDAEARWPEEGIRALQEAGIGGLVVPRASGGMGMGLSGLIRVSEEIGQACASTALCFGMHCVGTAVIASKASEWQQQEYLEPICKGEHLTTLALSEPSSGSHFYFPLTKLERTNGLLRINGEKVFVTSGGHADSYVLSTATAGPVGEFSCVVVPGTADGLSWGDEWDGLGMRGNSSRSLSLENVVIPEGDLLGEEGEQIWYVFHVVAPYFVAAMAGTYLGIASAALEAAVDSVKGRHYAHSGTDLDRVEVVQHRLGSLWTCLERTRRLVYFAGAELEAGGPRALPALFAAKADVADCVVKVVNEAMTLTGGRSYSQNAEMWRYLRDARAAHIMAPTTDLMHTWTGRALLDLPILEG